MSNFYFDADGAFINYDPVSVPGLKGRFRGPGFTLEPGGYGVCIGAGQTFGRFVERPFPTRLSEKLGIPVLNLGIGGVGAGHFRRKDFISVINGAKWCVVQVMSGRSSKNDFFDAVTGENAFGLVKGSSGPAAFAEKVIRHALFSESQSTVRSLIHEIRRSWRSEMYWLSRSINVPKILLYFSDRDIDYTASSADIGSFASRFPHFIDYKTYDAVVPYYDAVTEVMSDRGRPHKILVDGKPVSLDMGNGTKSTVNRYYPTPEMHSDASSALCRVIQDFRKPKVLSQKSFSLIASFPISKPKISDDEIRPNFLVIGAAKSGTSALVSQLARHPDIFVPDIKEAHFFDRHANGDRGLNDVSWIDYMKLFRGGRGFPLRGEGTVSYTMMPLVKGVPAKIKRYLGDVKLVYIVRDPMQRIISQYRHWLRNNRPTESFDNWLRREDVLATTILRSDYDMQIAPFVDEFGDDAIKVFFYEDYRKDYRKTLRECFSFLGADDYAVSFIPNEMVNIGARNTPKPDFSRETSLYVASIIRDGNVRFLTKHKKSPDIWPSLMMEEA